MKRFRFFLRALLIFVSLLAFGGWWVTWPDRTIKQFVEFLRKHEFDEMSGLMATQEDLEFVEFMKKAYDMEQHLGEQPESQDAPAPELEQEDRSWSDIFLGRAFFYRMDTGFYVQRGRVSFESFDPER
ncbi:MAG: hypothetical protein JNM43_20955 [Planctomycetaceae bacterium]|nr:hypothetical protein [Planctomycetaceae bacterium]